MSDAVVMVAIVVTGLVLATLGIVAIVFGKKPELSAGPDEVVFRADGGTQRDASEPVSTGRRSAKAKP